MKLPKLSTIMERLTPRQLLIICGVVALLIFLLIYFTLTRLTAEKPKPEPAPAPKQVQVKDVTVVTAKTSIPERTLIKEEMLSLKTMPSNKVPNGALTRTTDLVGRPTRIDISAGEVITGQKVYASVSDMGLSGRIPPECRAVTVGINDVTGVSGFARPGDYVDVMLVSSQVENNKVTSELILQNVLLLAINQAADTGNNRSATNDKNQKQNANTNSAATGSPARATLALTPEDVLKLTAKAQMGQIYLSLRPYHPAQGISDDTYYSVTKASGKMPVTPPPAGTIPPGADIETSPTANVQVIRGTTTTVGR